MIDAFPCSDEPRNALVIETSPNDHADVYIRLRDGRAHRDSEAVLISRSRLPRVIQRLTEVLAEMNGERDPNAPTTSTRRDFKSA